MGINSENFNMMQAQSFGNGEFGGSGFDEFGGFGEMSGHDRFMEYRAEQMYRSLAEKGEFGEIDKAKHNENYRNYLLANYDEFF